MAQIEWSVIAENDLNQIIDYIAQDSVEYALSFYEQIREKTEILFYQTSNLENNKKILLLFGKKSIIFIYCSTNYYVGVKSVGTA